MMKRSLVIAACLLTAAGAWAQPPMTPAPTQQTPPQTPPANPAPSMGEKTGVDSMLKMTPSTEEFVKDATTSGLFEVAESKLAAKHGDAQTKTFAQRMIKDHEKANKELKGLIKSAKVDVVAPTSLDQPHRDKIDKLKQQKGEDFDKLYGEDQIDAHKDAVSLFQRYSDKGDNPALKAWAAKTLPTLQEHLQLAQALPH